MKSQHYHNGSNRSLMFLFRWCDEKVSSLELSAPLTITPTLTVEQTIEIMNKEGYDQLPVVDSTG